MRRAIPFLLLGILLLLTVGAAILGAMSRAPTSPSIDTSSSCRVLSSNQAATLLRGPVSGPPLSPFLSPDCVYKRGRSRLSVSMDESQYVVSHFKALITGQLALTCASLSEPPNCRIPPVHRTMIDGLRVIWLGGRAPRYPSSGGTALTVRKGIAIETLALNVRDFRVVVLGSMRDVLENS